MDKEEEGCPGPTRGDLVTDWTQQPVQGDEHSAYNQGQHGTLYLSNKPTQWTAYNNPLLLRTLKCTARTRINAHLVDRV